MRPSTWSDRGAVTTEMVLITPVLVMLMLFIVLVGRYTTARADMSGVARDAARAASIERSADAARSAAESAATDALARTDLACQSVEVRPDVSGFDAGGIVSVEVACTVRLGDLGLLGIPGSRTITGDAAEPVDRYRAVDR